MQAYKVLTKQSFFGVGEEGDAFLQFSCDDAYRESFVLLKNELTKYYSANNLINVKTNIVSLQKKFIDLASATVSRVKGVVKDKIKGFLS